MWQVHIKKKVLKKLSKLPQLINQKLAVLILELEELGPVRGNWANYSKLEANKHHYHLSNSYVACWEEINVLATNRFVRFYSK
jgi:mRNA-degrading endonuclease RelE of RelBE toxin-antitoxin system